MKKFIFVLAFVALFVSCASNSKSGTAVAPSVKAKETEDKSISVKSKNISFETEPGSLSITNDTSKDVVVFVGNVEKDLILGGIYAYKSRSFDLRRVPSIPSNGSLLIRVATLDSYEKKSRITKEDVIFTGLVVYDFNSDSKQSLTIYKGAENSHKYCIYVSNESSRFVLELRKDNPTGEVVATLAPLERFKKIYLDPRADGVPYDFYPTFQYVNAKSGEIVSFNVPGKEDCQQMDPDQDDGSHVTPIIFEEPSGVNLSYNVAFVTLRNDTKAGITFWNGNDLRANDRGRRFTPSGRTDVYQLDTERPNGSSYSSLICKFNGAKDLRLGTYTFKPGYKYEIIATDKNGTYEYDIHENGLQNIPDNARITLFNE